MIIKYDALDRAEIPVLTLCNPGSVYNSGKVSKAQCILTDTSAEEIVFNFNTTSELNFVITKVDHDEYNNESSPYTLTQNRRLVFVQDIGYFIITNVSDRFNNGVWQKDVTARSIEAECEQRQVPFIEDGTYRFSTGSGNTGLFNMIVDNLPLWTIGHVDSTVASRYRTFEDVSTDTNCLSFMLQDMQNAYECIFVFDIINRVIDVYSQDNYVVRTNIHITPDDLVDSLTVSEDADDLYTAISVYGQNNLTINAINPTGGNTLYNFDYYKSWMSPALSTAVGNWQTAIDNAKDNYYSANLTYFNDMTSLSNLQMQLETYETQLSLYQKMSDNLTAEGGTYNAQAYNDAITAAGGTPISISGSISEIKSRIASKVNEVKSSINTTQASIESTSSVVESDLAAVTSIQASVNMNRFLTPSQVAELTSYIYEGSYTDEYITTTENMTYSQQFAQMKELYDRAVKQLRRVSSPTQQFSVDAENFIFEKRFAAWSEQIETGCLINVELHEGDVAQLFLTNMTINYDDKTLSMTFGNRFNRFDPRALFEDVLGGVKKSANALGFIKELLYPVKNGELDDLTTAINNSRSLTLASALAAHNENVTIDETGYTGKRARNDGTFDPRQIKITSRNIVLTDDAWETAKVAIGEIIIDNETSVYGVNADTVMGGVIIGGSITGSEINNGNGTFHVDSQGNLTATSAEITGDIIANSLTLGEDVTIGYSNFDSATQTMINNGSSAAENSLTSSLPVYYRSTVETTPTISSATVIGDTWNTDNVWSYRMQAPKKNCFFYTCQRYVKNGTVYFSDVKQVSNASYTSKWCMEDHPAYINGGAIYANTITANQIQTGAITISKMDDDAKGKLIIGTTVNNEYNLSTSSSTANGTWEETIPTWSSGKYLWIRVKTTKTYADNSTATTYSTARYDRALTTALSTASSASSTANGGIKSTVSCYYRSSSHSTPSITTSTSIGTSDDTNNAWEYVMPKPKKNTYFYTCEKYTKADDTVSFSAVREMSTLTHTSLWCSSTNSTYIDGDAIYAGSVTSEKIHAGAITADKISITDYADISGAKIGGWSITSDQIRKDAVVDSVRYRARLMAPSDTAPNTIAFAVLNRDETNPSDPGAWSYPFYVRYDGYLRATNANITGKITAEEGQIGRYTITSTYLSTGSGSTTAGMGGNQAFWAGAESSASAPFRVTYAGALVATNATIEGSITTSSGKIGGWDITSTEIHKSTTIDGTTHYAAIRAPANPTSGNAAFYIQKGTGNDATFPFYVNYGGHLHSVDGDIGGFTIDSTSIRSGATSGTSNGNITLSTANFDRVINGTSRNLRFAIGANFGVTSSGVIYASSANISGTITTSSGSIGGWDIAATQIRKSTAESGGYRAGISAPANATTSNRAFFIADETGSSTTYPFSVFYDGSLTATKATITGTITANGGKIGKFSIAGADSYMSTGSGSTTAGMGGNQAFWAGASSSASAPFRVSYAGALVATNATITGTITANTLNLASGLTIGGGHIGTGINADNITTGTINADRISADTIKSKYESIQGTVSSNSLSLGTMLVFRSTTATFKTFKSDGNSYEYRPRWWTCGMSKITTSPTVTQLKDKINDMIDALNRTYLTGSSS